MRIAIGKLSHETHTMSNQRTDVVDFKKRDLFYDDEILSNYQGVNDCVGGYLDVLDSEDVEIIPTIAAAAMPGGLVTEATYNRFKSELTERIDQVTDLDGVLLDLHGAMVVEGLDAPEADLTVAVRDIVGETVPIVCTTDPHGNISEAFINELDGLFAYNTIPHIDQFERGVEAAERILEIIRREFSPKIVNKKLPILTPVGFQLSGYEGAKGPLPQIMERAFEWETEPGIINVNVYVGFPPADTPYVGANIVVMTDNEPSLGEEAAADVGEFFWDIKEEFLMETYTPEDAISKALESDAVPIVLHDAEDAASAGATADGTEILRHMLDMEVPSGTLWLSDPEVVQEAMEAGIGAVINTTVGGKRRWRIDDAHAEPLPITGRVTTLSEGQWVIKGPSGTGRTVNMGPTVVLRIDNVDLVVSENRIDPKDPELFRSVGIEPTDRKVIGLKSVHHWRAAWESEVEDIITVHCPNDHSMLTVGRPPEWEYHNIPRPMWPLDENIELDF
ncbi:MAG: M81 family metallopeptidase [Halobacteriales archaeon]